MSNSSNDPLSSTSLMLFLDIFFFSSRRRHTRFDCDWSSDVCSSDLGARVPRHPAPTWASSDPHRPGAGLRVPQCLRRLRRDLLVRRVLILVENLPSPFDRRVWQEAGTLRDAGDLVSIAWPTRPGREVQFEVIDAIYIYRDRLPL